MTERKTHNGDAEHEITDHSSPDSSDDTTDSPEDGAVDSTARIERLEQTVAALTERLIEIESKPQRKGMSRRSILGLLGIGGLVGLGSGTATADPQGQIGTRNDPLRDLYTVNIQSPTDGLEFRAGGYSAGEVVYDGQEPDIRLGSANTVSTPSAGRTISGGSSHAASGEFSTVGGGSNHEASDHYTSVGGGTDNIASFPRATVAGGGSNTAGGGGATVGGGRDNSATADYATIPGGDGNSASAPYSFAAGKNASANHQGAFVWSDTSSGGLASLNANEFAVSAAGGVFFFSNESATTGVELSPGSGAWASASSRALKYDIESVSGEAVLDRVTDLEISRWSYDSQEGVRHMGPMAEDFHDAFGLGADEEQISNVDADGVALAAIQGLAEHQAEATDQREATAERVAELEQENEALRDRLTALEAHVDECSD